MALKAAQVIANVWTKPLKRAFFPPGRSATKVRFGAFRGLVLELDYSCQSQVVFGLAEREVMGHLKRLCRSIGTAVDIGVGDGEYAIYFLLRTNARKVYAIEPSESAWRTIPRNLDMNGLSGDPRFQGIRGFAGERPEGETVRLDDVLDGAEGPIFVKVDVDGGEGEVLRGARLLLDRTDVRWLVETHSPGLEREVMDILAAQGYKTKIIRNAWWRWFVPERRQSPHNRWCVAWKELD